MLLSKDNVLHFTYDSELVQIESWGPNAFRIRATKFHTLPADQWALTETPPEATPSISVKEDHATITNGNITATISSKGKIIIKNAKGERLLEEYVRNRNDVLDPKCSSLMVDGREFKPLLGGDYHLTYRLESIDPKEKLYGMGQYQQQYLDLKGLDLEMAQRNSQASVPFMLSSLGYGFLWNNPAVGRAVLGKNTMSFEALSTKALDYWIVCADTPAQIVEAYADVTGKVPMMPEYGLGFWQCKLRYQTQEELLDVAREYRKRNLPLDVIVVDFFHCKLFVNDFWSTLLLTNPQGRNKESGSLIQHTGKTLVSLPCGGYCLRGRRRLLCHQRPPILPLLLLVLPARSSSSREIFLNLPSLHLQSILSLKSRSPRSDELSIFKSSQHRRHDQRAAIVEHRAPGLHLAHGRQAIGEL